jgi:hypothetical protein
VQLKAISANNQSDAFIHFTAVVDSSSVKDQQLLLVQEFVYTQFTDLFDSLYNDIIADDRTDVPNHREIIRSDRFVREWACAGSSHSFDDDLPRLSNWTAAVRQFGVGLVNRVAFVTQHLIFHMSLVLKQTMAMTWSEVASLFIVMTKGLQLMTFVIRAFLSYFFVRKNERNARVGNGSNGLDDVMNDIHERLRSVERRLRVDEIRSGYWLSFTSILGMIFSVIAATNFSLFLVTAAYVIPLYVILAKLFMSNAMTPPKAITASAAEEIDPLASQSDVVEGIVPMSCTYVARHRIVCIALIPLTLALYFPFLTSAATNDWWNKLLERWIEVRGELYD